MEVEFSLTRSACNKRTTNNKYFAVLLSLLLFFSFVTWQKYGAGLMDVIPIVIISLLLFFAQNRKMFFGKPEKVIIIFYISVILSSFFASLVFKYDFSFRTVLSFGLSAFLTCIFISIKYNISQLILIKRVYIITSLIGTISIVINYLSGNNEGFLRYSASFFGTMRDSLYVCAFQMGALYLLVFDLLFSLNKHKIVLLLCSLMIIVGQLLTGNRTAILIEIFIFVYCYITFLIKNKNPTKTIISIVLLLLVLLVLFVILNKVISSYIFERLFSKESYNLNDQSRLGIWASSIEYFFKSPIFGVGLDNNSKLMIASGGHPSHNSILDILVGQGIIGIVIFIYFLLVCVKESKCKVFTFGFVVASLGTLFFVNGYNTMSFWVPIILIAVFSKMYSKNGTIRKDD